MPLGNLIGFFFHQIVRASRKLPIHDPFSLKFIFMNFNIFIANKLWLADRRLVTKKILNIYHFALY